MSIVVEFTVTGIFLVRGSIAQFGSKVSFIDVPVFILWIRQLVFPGRIIFTAESENESSLYYNL